MSANSKIEWTHHTFNPWWGCVRVSPGCERCYAEAWAKRTGHAVWGVQAPRRELSESYWRQPIRWNRDAQEAGERRRVFCASMADVFEARPELDRLRARLWDLISETPHLDWLLLTKRPENIVSLRPWAEAPHNVWLGTTVERIDYLRRVEALNETPAPVHFVSYEPALGGVNFIDHLEAGMIDWLIVGGESGPGARPFHVGWARVAVRSCKATRVPVFVKQLGTRPLEHIPPSGAPDDGGDLVPLRLADKKGGAMDEWPEGLRIREFPK